jgi:hypothetical protein
MLSGLYLTVYAADNGEEITLLSRCYGGDRERNHFRAGRVGFIDVNEDYEANVLEIAESDEDVQELLGDGYGITGVRPIIKPTVGANGDVTTQATNAIVMLENEDTTNHATVWVDLGEGQVTQIVIVTRTVIDKT